VSREFLCSTDRRVVAVVTDEPPPRPIRAFTDRAVEAIADLVCDRFGLGAHVRGALKLRVRPPVSTLRADQSERKAALGRSDRMARTTNRKSSARRGSRTGRKTSSRGGGRSAAGRKGGNATLRSRGPEFYSEIGRKGGRSRSRNARRTGSARGGTRTGARRSGSSGRGGARAGRKGGSRSMRRSSR
jgi:hypothetical protein